MNVNAPPHHLNLRPTLSLRALVWLTRVVWWLVLLAVLLGCAVWAGLNFFIVPRIDSLRPVLELQATQMLGRPLRIGAIRAETDGRLLPSFELQEVMLYERVQAPEPAGVSEGGAISYTTADPALYLPRVRVKLSLSALLRLGFDQLVIEQPDLTVRRTADGRLFIAGIEVPQTSSGEGRLADWVLSQSEWRITGGRVYWIDETRDVSPVDLRGLEFRLRNGARTHEWRLDAEAPAELGGRLSLRGRFREPLFFARAGDWQRWDGQLYAELERVDLDALKQRVDWPAQLAHIQAAGGSGALRAWVDVEEGRVNTLTVDLALRQLQLRLGTDLPALELNRLAGRIGARWGSSLGGSLQDGAYEVYTEGLRFDTGDGLVWPGGDARVSLAEYRPGQTLGALRLQDIDLAVLADLARYLPLSAQAHQALHAYAPHGRIERLQANWQGMSGAMPERYEAVGRVVGLELAAQMGMSSEPRSGPDMRAGDANAHATTGARASGRVTPGVAGLSVDFDLNQEGGSAKLQFRQGHLELPGLFEVPRFALDPFSADLRWRLKAGQLDSVQINNARIANADLQGEFQGEWKAPPQEAQHASSTQTTGRRLGLLDLQGNFSRVDLAQVHRYLPLSLPVSARNYVHDALPQGRASQVRVRLRGELDQFPFRQGAGEFRVTAQVQDTTFVYVPPSLQSTDQLPWPVLKDVRGEFVMDRASLQLRNFSAALAGTTRVQLAQSQIQIPELGPGLRVQTDLNFTGALDDMLQRMVAASPLDALRTNVLAHARATGDAAARLKLDLPLADLKASTVQGQLLLAGNTLRPVAGMPALTQVRGIVHFSERGFALSAVQARLFGGEVQAEGGTMPVPGALTLQSTFKPALLPMPVPTPSSTSQSRLRVQGQFTAQGLRQAGQEEDASEVLRRLAALARQMEGGARYEAEFGLNEGAPEFSLRTDLRGLTLSLPAPLRKPADQSLPLRLRLERAAPRDEREASLTLPSVTAPAAQQGWHDLISLEVGRLLQLRYERVHEAGGERPRVLRGQWLLDLAAQDWAQAPRVAPALPDAGVHALLRLGTFDVNAWLDAVDPGTDKRSRPAQSLVGRAGAVDGGRSGPETETWLDYLPTQLRVLGDRVQMGKQSLHALEADATREGGSWRAQLSAQEISGDLSYRMPLRIASTANAPAVEGGAGHLHARLSRLVLDISADEIDPLRALDPTRPTHESRDIATLDALDLPALDVVIEQLRLGKQSLGRVELEAGHAPAPAATSGSALAGGAWVWQLKRMRVVMPEADFTAQGQWPAMPSASTEPSTPGAVSPVVRRSTVDFQLEVKDGGRLLARLGKPGLIEGGAGTLRGQLGWDGLPWRPAIAVLDGTLRIRIEQGQFLKVEPGAARLLGILSLQSLPRRLLFDFRDFFSEGFAFDFVRGNVQLVDGVARTNNLQMKGVTAAVLMSGQADLNQETQDLRVVIVPEINAGTASLIAAWINPAVGLTTFLAQAILRRPAIAAATQEYHVTGSWVNPQVEKVERGRDEGKPSAGQGTAPDASQEEPSSSNAEPP
ncbi:hypothetical protein AZ34_01790 [Hylemonella gracilis str. Niagara R]|uniref:YhdP central domain-containing protein n=1 Tax=Hylemonella gracilis str. Niagara R TaxID=1458275 RepID=A0A016XDN6_9BURK|nr:AsmA-like C-terminal region-containing protein [Hylemonella gracilis]EYC49931.1 hypothetical protein AZ34_01790 [Hylemonella gracilis str. Niagara R]